MINPASGPETKSSILKRLFSLLTLQRLRQSLPTRLFLLFIATSLAIILLLTVTLIDGFAKQWRFMVRPHMQQYLEYVKTDLGDPPDAARAEELASRLPINIYIEGPDENYSSTGKPLNTDDIDFHHDDKRWRRHVPEQYRKDLPRQSKLTFGEHQDRSVLIHDLGEYKVYFELPHNERRNDNRNQLVHKVLIGTLVLLTLCFLLLRRMLKPVQDITKGVSRMGTGDLAYRVPIRTKNDLGKLAGSINTMASDIDQMLDAKRQLLLGVSHELRSPLTRATIAAELLPETANKERIKTDLAEMESLIAKILETERLDSPHAALTLSEVSLNQLVEEVIEELAPDGVIEFKYPEHNILLEADVTRMHLVLRNLLSNAQRYGGSDTPPIVTLGETGSGAEKNISLSVKDFGPGIPPEHIDKVTEPFYRADPSRTRSTGGFGLGLYLSKRIVEAHGGTLAVISPIIDDVTTGQKLKGTLIQVVLPHKRS